MTSQRKINKVHRSDKRKDRINSKNEFTSAIYYIPIIFVILIIPLIVKMKNYKSSLGKFSWAPSDAELTDFFLYYKMIAIIIVALIMMTIILYSYIKKEIEFENIAILIPLFLYGALGFLSSVFSEYRDYSFLGTRDQFESQWVLLSYCLFVYYSITYVRSEIIFKKIISIIIFSGLIMSALAISQMMGKDFYNSALGNRMITSMINPVDLEFMFEKGRVYLSLYNPNYVGVYTGLFIPILVVMLLFTDNVKKRLIIFISLVGLVLALVGSKSLSGLLGIMVSLIFAVILLRKVLIRKWFVTVPMLVLSFLLVLAINDKNDIVTKLFSINNLSKTTYNLNEIQTLDDYVLIKYKENDLKIKLLLSADNTISFDLKDEYDIPVPFEYIVDQQTFIIKDVRFENIMFAPIHYREVLGFELIIDNKQWLFTNAIDETYYYINQYGKHDKIITPETVLFDEYASFASNRGYIWSRTIPLLKDYAILGSGADAYVMAFPQQDYVGLSNIGMSSSILTKPHSLYLQMAVQTGGLSLIAFLVFYAMYFCTSIKLYFNGKYENYYEQVGGALFIGTISYMIIGLANDSSITTAPLFWVLIGVGIAANRKVQANREFKLN